MSGENSAATENVKIEINDDGKEEMATETTIMNAVADKVQQYINDNFETIKEKIVSEIKDLESKIPLLNVVTLLIQHIENDNGKYKLEGLQKKQVVVLICTELGKELSDSRIPELKVLGDLLSNKENIENQIDICFNIYTGKLKFDLSDGIDDELEVVVTCYQSCIPFFSYLKKKCVCGKSKNKE